VLHLLGALAGREYLPHQYAGHAEREQRHDRDDDHPGQVGATHAGGGCRRRRDIPEHSTSWNSERKTLPIGTEQVAGSLRTCEPNHEHEAIPNNFVIFSLLSRYISVTTGVTGDNWQVACAHGRPAYLADGLRTGGRAQAVGAAEGQLIRTLTPELVDETCT